MKFSEFFKIQKDPSTGENLISIHELYSILTNSGDTLPKKQLNRSLRTFQGGSKTVLGEEYATFQAVFRFLCNYSSLSGCRKLLKTIEKEIVCADDSVKSTSFELYKLIAKTSFQRTSLLFNKLQVNENDIPTLLSDHRHHFTELEWKRICWFENDFSKFVEFKELSYEESLNLKCSRFQHLLSLSECCKGLHESSKRYIRSNFHRFKLSERHNEIRLSANQAHIASVLDNDFKYVTDLFCPSTVENVLCFDVTLSSEKNVIWAVFIQSDTIEIDFDDLCKRVFFTVKRRHNVYLEKAFLLDQATALKFNSSNGTVSRFYLRDSLETGKIANVLKVWSADLLIDDTIDVLEENLCERCFTEDSNNKPLNTETFDIVDEWFLQLPLETQVILEQFVNVQSVRNSKEPEEISRNKLEKLYIAYDTLLNIYNKVYIGIFQRSNANKLLIEYKNIGSVFNVTHSTGATPGLTYAEQKLKNEAHTDLCYYNTYLKEHQLNYEAINGELKSCVNLRKCHLILMLDNLVRLQYIADPDPGVHRSKQLCTLPITVQGLPVDSYITDQWHLPDCDGTFNCHCKQVVPLADDCVSQTLVELCEDEREAHKSFLNWMVFGNHLIWKKLPDDLLEQIEESHLDGSTTSKLESEAEIQSDETELADNDEEFDTDCQDEDLVAVLDAIECETPDPQVSQYLSEEEDEMSDLTILEKSIDEMSILEQGMPQGHQDTIQDRLKEFGFKKFKVPPLLCRHPPPATGRDDDVQKIREILEDVLVKSGYEADPDKGSNRILCGPDNKIGKCLFQLMDRDAKYNVFLPEFPLLHLRKSKINILISAYQKAGLLEILQVMRNDEKNDWGSLISIQHIDIATRHIRRLAMAFHLAFLLTFTQHLERTDLQEFLSDMEAGNCAETSGRWSKRYSDFLEYGSMRNSTFALHVDMMRHCNDIVAILFAERLGGTTGYSLLLGAVKSSLLFSFVNGATSYAPYCAQLLHSHYTAGHFHQCLKRTLYTTPFKNSGKNFATDTKREMDHLDVVKGFRSGSSIDSVTCRMSLIDSLNETSQMGDKDQEPMQEEDKLGMDISETDLNHVYPGASLILRRGGISIEKSMTPFNVYSKTPLKLPSAILDSASDSVGRYLLNRYIHKQKLTKFREPAKTDINGPKELVNRAKRSKGVTIKRIQKSKVVPLKTERQTKEETRLKVVAKESKIIDALSSENNACQALLKPDSSKPKVAKALCIQRALKNLVESCSPTITVDHYISLNEPYVPKIITQSTQLCTMEFAGTKFKMGNVKSGEEYIGVVEKTLKALTKHSPVEKMVICEEKYSYTPDDFKANTREQRKVNTESDVSHLKSSDNILSDSVYDSTVITKTSEGKKLISTYLAKNIDKLKMDKNMDIIVDSELISKTECECSSICDCRKSYSVPLLCKFNENSCPEITEVRNIQQRKGEAEMAVVDWLLEFEKDLKPGKNAVCYVSSGDIDAVYIHLYAVSEKCSRNCDGTFKNDVFVVLQKSGGKFDVYNITAMLSLFEHRYNDRKMGMKIAFSLCIGGNDFIPKLFGVSHDTVMKEILFCIHFRTNLFASGQGKIKVNKEVFLQLVKLLYTPKRLRGKNISYNEVRALTINKKEDSEQKGGYKTSHPQKWLPPSSAIERLCDIIQLQVQYLETVGHHDSGLPAFLECGVITRNSSGEVEYNFGPDRHFHTIRDLPSISTNRKSSKRTLANTPQHGARRKVPLLTSTPRSAKSVE